MLLLGAPLLGLAVWVIAYLLSRRRHPFWSGQPVLLPWDVQCLFDQPAVWPYPEERRSEETSSCPIGRREAEFLASFIGKHYLSAQATEYSPSAGVVEACMPSRCSMLTTWTRDGVTAGAIASCWCVAKYKNDNLSARYVDWLCVDPAYRKRGICQALISDHVQDTKCGTSVFFFKREGALGPIVPMCTYEIRVVRCRAEQSGVQIRGCTSVKELLSVALRQKGTVHIRPMLDGIQRFLDNEETLCYASIDSRMAIGLVKIGSSDGKMMYECKYFYAKPRTRTAEVCCFIKSVTSSVDEGSQIVIDCLGALADIPIGERVGKGGVFCYGTALPRCDPAEVVAWL